MQAGCDSPDGDVQGVGDLGVAEIFPGVEQQDVPLTLPQAGQYSGQRTRGGFCVDPGGNLRREDVRAVKGSRRIRARVRTVLADLVSPSAADQIGGDPVEPGQGACRGLVVTVSAFEGDQERLTDQVVSLAAAEPTGDVAVDRDGMPIDSRAKSSGAS